MSLALSAAVLLAVAPASAATGLEVSLADLPVAIRCEVAAADAPTVAKTAPASNAADSALVALYAAGIPWQDFLGAARARRAQWFENAARPLAPADAVSRAQALPGRWRLLVVAVDSCSDSVNTIPYLAQLVAQVPQLEMRIITPEQGRPVMEARRTPDGRPATPTVVILDAAGNEVGCWVERPAALQAIAMEARASGGMAAFVERKAAWYTQDAGASTVAEVVAQLERAAAGQRGCDAPKGRVGQ